MTRLISWLIMIPLAVVVVIFTIANRGMVRVDLWPLPVDLSVPLFSLALAGGLVGFLAGALVAWLSGAGKRRLCRRLRRQLEAAKAEEASLKKRISGLEQPPPPLLPVSDAGHSRADAA